MLERTGHIHFIGIGGIGMSGIAELLINLGFTISGSDVAGSEITERLVSLGATVHIGHTAGNVAGSESVVVSSAIKPGNPEVDEARRLGIPVIPRSEMLGELMRMRTGIAVAGAHGKTTTTSLAAMVLDEAGLDPTIVVGGRVKALHTNARLGEGRYLVAEADESDGNFVHLSPVYAIITNIDAEHLDFYGGLENILDAFVTFARRVPFNGAVICCIDDSNVRSVIKEIDRRIITYGFSVEADIVGTIEEYREDGTAFSITIDGKHEDEFFLRLPGRHNVSNAIAVCAIARELDISTSHVRAAFAKFEGVARRFEIKGEAGGVLVVDDYGHHPTEVQATIETARRSFDRRIVVVFQPHRYTRTRDLHERFDRCFEDADELYVTDVYAAGEHAIPGVTGDLVYRAAMRGGVRSVSYLPGRDDLKTTVMAELKRGDMLLTLGAGDICELGEEILKELEGI